jgi:ABC-2 type transport system permease protein
MRNAIAILRKELRLYFTTPVAYVVFAVFTIVTSFFFLRILTHFQRTITANTQMQPQLLQYLNFTDHVIAPLLVNVAVILVFAIPFLTMRLVAEERRTRSFELLMTCPVRPWQIAVGKYAAALAVVAVMLVIVLIYPVLVAAYAQIGSVAWTTVLTGLLGLFLLGAGFTAVGLFISSLTSSQIIAAFVSWCVLMLLWVIGWAAADNTGLTRDILAGLSAVEHIRGFTRGLIDMKDLVYYLTLAGFGLFLTHRSLESQRWR